MYVVHINPPCCGCFACYLLANTAAVIALTRQRMTTIAGTMNPLLRCHHEDSSNCGQYHSMPHEPFAGYAKLRVAHAPGMPETFSPPPRVSDADMHHGTCVTHVPWCMSGSLTSGFLLSRWRGQRSRHSRPMHNPQFYVSGKRPMESANGFVVVCFALII